MSSIGLLLISALTVAPSSFQVLDKDAHSPMAQAKQGRYIIAQQYDGDDPHGLDPHGKDPHSERHDLSLPANSNPNYPANTDMTGGVSGNNNSPAPYNGSNY